MRYNNSDMKMRKEIDWIEEEDDYDDEEEEDWLNICQLNSEI